MDYRGFYRQLFAPLVTALGSFDRDTLAAVVGFDVGGPLNFCTVGRENKIRFVTYVSCELAVRDDQQSNELGRYELLTSCDDEQWVRSVVSDIGRMSLEVTFGHGHTLDIGPWVEPGAPIQGVVFEKVYSSQIEGEPYGVLRVIGVTRPEMEYAERDGVPGLLARLSVCGIYPNTEISRRSVV